MMKARVLISYSKCFNQGQTEIKDFIHLEIIIRNYQLLERDKILIQKEIRLLHKGQAIW